MLADPRELHVHLDAVAGSLPLLELELSRALKEARIPKQYRLCARERLVIAPAPNPSAICWPCGSGPKRRNASPD